MRSAFGSLRVRSPLRAGLGAVLSLVLAGCALAGCDLLGLTGPVEGRVVDAATGDAPRGTVTIAVNGSPGFLSSGRLLLEGETDADGRFNLGEPDEDPDEVLFYPQGRIAYPGVDTTGIFPDPYSSAYFQMRTPGQRRMGTVELYPTCHVYLHLRFSRPVATNEQVKYKLVPIPEIPGGVSRFASEGIVQGEYGPVPAEDVRLLGVGGRRARLEWSINQYNPPTGNGQTFGSGSVDIEACPRHDVLDADVAIALPR